MGRIICISKDVEIMMDAYTTEDLKNALKLTSSVINRCEKAQSKFAEGTPQHSLLKNRLKALYISRSFLEHEQAAGDYKTEELSEALKPILSIIGKCEKAKQKFAQGTSHYTRFQNMIKTMNILRYLITKALEEKLPGQLGR